MAKLKSTRQRILEAAINEARPPRRRSWPTTELDSYAQPSLLVIVPGHGGVTVSHSSICQNSDGLELLMFEYFGTAEALVAAAVATVQMLAISGNTGKRPRRVDDRKYPYWRSFWWVGVKQGNPQRVFKLARYRPKADYADLPGAAEAIAAYSAYVEWQNRRDAQRHTLRGRMLLVAESDDEQPVPTPVQHQVAQLLQKFMR